MAEKDVNVAPPAPTSPVEKPMEQASVDEIYTGTKEDTPATTGAKEGTIETTDANGDKRLDAVAVTAGGDTDMGGTTEATEVVPTTEANGISIADKKTDKSRRKSTGVPEHKSKKLNRKKSMPVLQLDAKPGQLYLARMKGHPPWPSIIADDAMLPESIARSRPVTAPNADGGWRRPEYAPGGKRHHERTYAIMFLFTNEFAWIPNSDLAPLTADECKDVSEKGKSKTLLSAYKEAAEGHDLEHYKGLLKDHADALAEEEAARAEREAEREAEKARKAEKKNKRKSEANNAEDEMDVDDESSEAKPKSKKRKKEAGSDNDEKPAKTSKTTKLKLSTPKTPTTGEKSANKKDAAKSAKKKHPVKAAGSDEDTETPVAEERQLTAQEKHAKREQEIKYCRHKLQRGLLSRDTVPSHDEVKTLSGYLHKLEGHPELEADIIRSTKIHKVLKGIIKLPSIPKEEQYNFKKRSHDLLALWNKILADSPADEKVGDKEDDKKDAPTLNGEVKTGEREKAEDKAVEEKTEEKADGLVLTKEDKENNDENKIGTNVEGEKEIEEPTAHVAENSMTDEPDVAKAPGEEYKPPPETVEATA